MIGGPKSHQEAVVLLSGGVDSMLCAHLLRAQGFRIRGLFVDFGQAARNSERTAANAIARHLEIDLSVIEIRGGPDVGAGEISARNAFLISAACFCAGSRSCIVSIGVHAGTSYYDCSPAFINRIAQLAEEQSEGRVTVVAPLLTWSKTKIYEAFSAADLPLSLTYSCESGDAPCGVCLSCKDRQATAC